MEFTRRDFLKLGPVYLGGFFLAACGPDKVNPDPVESRLYYDDNPFASPENIEHAIALGELEAHEFGPETAWGFQKYRMVQMKNIKDDIAFFPKKINLFASDIEADAMVGSMKEAMEGVGEVLLVQQRSEFSDAWEPMPLPATMATITMFRDVNSVLAQDYPDPIRDWTAKARMNAAMHEELTTEGEAIAIVEELVPESVKDSWIGRVALMRGMTVALPESLPTEAIAAIHKTEFFPLDEASLDTLQGLAKNCGQLQHAIFAPKEVPEWFLGAIEAWKERLVEFEPEPEVCIVTREDKLSGQMINQMFVRHRNSNGSLDEGNSLLDYNGSYGLATDEMIAGWDHRNLLEEIGPDTETGGKITNYFKTDESLFASGPIMIRRVKPGHLDIFMVPNDFLGQSRARGAYGLKFGQFTEDDVEHKNPSPAVMLFSNMMRDKLFSVKMIEQPFKSWLTELTGQLRPLIKQGVTRIDKWGGMPPLQSLARLMQGFNDELMLHSSIIPLSPYMRGALLNELYKIYFSDEYNKQTNMAVVFAPEGLPVMRLEAKNLAGWIEKFGEKLTEIFKKPIEPLTSSHKLTKALESDGGQVVLHQGEAVPFGGAIITVDGKQYLTIGGVKRDQDGYAMAKERFGSGIMKFIHGAVDVLVVDRIPAVLVVPYEEARFKTMPLDPDPNAWEAFKLGMVLTSVVIIVAAPGFAGGLAGGAVTMGGNLARRAILKPIWNWMVSAGRLIIANGVKTLTPLK